jgi:alpha-beta hydrolase superfamily lysophospholipase
MFTQSHKNKRAIWYPAAEVKKTKGTILFLPGFPKYPSQSEFITFFNKEEYNVLVVLYSGTFDSDGKFSIENSVQDVNFWYDFLGKEIIQYGPTKTQKIKHKRIIMFSTSFGGLIAGLALKKYVFSKIKKCIFVSPLWDMVAYKDNKLNLKIADETSKIMSFAYPFSYRFENKKHFFEQIKGLIPITSMDKQFVDQQKNYIVFCGREDKVTPPMMSKALISNYKNSKLYILNGGHSSKIDLKKFIKSTKKNI